MNTKEVFRDVKNYEGIYQISNLGRIKSLPRKGCLNERVLRPAVNSNGYFVCGLYEGKVRKTYHVHQLVAIAFLNHKPCGHKLVVNHKNINKLDNRLENLEIVTQRENTNHKHIKSSSRFTGVYWNKTAKKWVSSIRLNKTVIYLGIFKCELAAAKAYQDKLKTIIADK